MNSGVKKTCEELLIAFTAQWEKEMPQEVLEYLGRRYPALGKQLKRLKLKPLEETTFPEDFEEFLLNMKVTPPKLVTMPAERHLYWGKQAVKTLQSYQEKTTTLQQNFLNLIEKRAKLQDKFEDFVVSECLGLDIVDLKIELFKKKCMERLLRKTPEMPQVLRKLDDILDLEAKSAKNHLAELEQLEKDYKSVQDDVEYQKMVKLYAQMSTEKESLVLMTMF